MEPECYEMDNFDIKMGYFYGSPDYKNKNLHYRKMVLIKKNIQGNNTKAKSPSLTYK